MKLRPPNSLASSPVVVDEAREKLVDVLAALEVCARPDCFLYGADLHDHAVDATVLCTGRGFEPMDAEVVERVVDHEARSLLEEFLDKSAAIDRASSLRRGNARLELTNRKHSDRRFAIARPTIAKVVMSIIGIII